MGLRGREKMLWGCLSCPARGTWDKRDRGALSDFLMMSSGAGCPPSGQVVFPASLLQEQGSKGRKNVNQIQKTVFFFFFFLKREKENESTSDIWSHNTLKSISLPLIFTVSSEAPVKWESSSISPYANPLPPLCAIPVNCLAASTPPTPG